MINFYFISIFPSIFKEYFKLGVLGKAVKEKRIKIKTYDLRKWALNKYCSIDDTPYGGGAGMIMAVEPIYKAIQAIKNEIGDNTNVKIVLLSAKGKKWTQSRARTLSKVKNIIFICGRYEGVDERVVKFIDQEISIGNYVLTGGELGAMVIADSCARLVDGVLGNSKSIKDESFSRAGIVEYPQYTKPAIFKADGNEYTVPEVLLSGNHKAINKWRNGNRLQK